MSWIKDEPYFFIICGIAVILLLGYQASITGIVDYAIMTFVAFIITCIVPPFIWTPPLPRCRY